MLKAVVQRLNLTVLFSAAVAVAVTGLVLLIGHTVNAGVREQALDSTGKTVAAMAAVAAEASTGQARGQADPAAAMRAYAARVPDVEQAALRTVYGRVLVASGPMPKGVLARPRLTPDGRPSVRLVDDHVVVDVTLDGVPTLPGRTVLTVVASYDSVASNIRHDTRRAYLILGIAASLLWLALLPTMVRASRAVADSAEQRDRKPLAELRSALREDRFEVHYQPFVELPSTTVGGWEALVRMRRRDGTLVPPGDFIALAERTGFIHELGAFVLDEACRQAAAWRAVGLPGIVGVNVAPAQLLSGDLTALVAHTLARHGLPATSLCLELTESAVRGDLSALRATLRSLRRLGVHLALDDFGADWSSLSRLRQLPLQVLKIDRSLVPSDAGDERATRMLEAIVSLGHALGVVVLCEGIETEEQLELVTAVGCDVAQGFLLGRPTAPEDAPVVGAARSLVPA